MYSSRKKNLWVSVLSEGYKNGEVKPAIFMRAVKNTQDRLISRLLRWARNDINWEAGTVHRFVPEERRNINYAQRAWAAILSGAYGVEGCINGEVKPAIFMRAVKNTQDRLISRLLHPGRTPAPQAPGQAKPGIGPASSVPQWDLRDKLGTSLRE